MWSLIEKKVYIYFKILLKLIGKELTDKSFDVFMQFVKFGIVGVSNTVLSYILYVVCLLLVHKLGVLLDVGYLVAQIIAFIISVIWSFYWNNKVVFTLQDGDERCLIKVLIKTFVSYSFTGLFLNAILLILWVKIMHISEFIAPFINLFISVPLNFIINKVWAFKKDIKEKS